MYSAWNGDIKMTRDLFAPGTIADFEHCMKAAAETAYDWSTFCITWSQNLTDFIEENGLTYSSPGVEDAWKLKKKLEKRIKRQRDLEETFND